MNYELRTINYIMSRNADVIIIGGGIIGCATSYYLAKSGLKVFLFEKEYLCSGSTGRCIGGVRQQFTTKSMVKLMIQSVSLFSQMEEEFGKSVEWYQGGYLFLAHSEEKKNDYLKAISLQKSVGLPVEFVTSQEVKKIIPGLNTDGLLGGAYCPTDGQANPFSVTYEYAKGIKRCGGKIFSYTEVKEIIVKGNRVNGIKTSKGEKYSAGMVLNAAGPEVKEVGKMVGVEIPVEPERHEALITEGVEKLFEPMLVDYRPDGCYFLQVHPTGQFIGCYTPVPPVPGKRVDSSFEFLTDMPRRMVRLVPSLKNVKVIRQWAGSYEMTPDGNPILDRTEIEGFYVCGGMCGHGFMLGPALGKIMAEFITSQKTSPPISEFALSRKFAEAEVMK
ncbi:MAG: FAD-binding oxidoreductase [Candidatus Edwardsbacteria bacterium]